MLEVVRRSAEARLVRRTGEAWLDDRIARLRYALDPAQLACVRRAACGDPVIELELAR